LTKVVKFLFRNVDCREVADCDLFPNLLGHGALLSLERPSLDKDRNILLFEGCVCALEQ
jgi:hypothetical protein